MKYLLSLGLVLSMLAFAFIKTTTRTIKGNVKDEHKKPIAGASIVVKGTAKKTQTDTKGNFSLTVSEEKPVLIISYVGYETKEVKIKKDSVLNIVLKPASTALDEVVVTGYDTQLQGKASGVAGSASTIRLRGIATTQDNMNSIGYYKPEEKKDKFDEEDWRFNNNFNTEGYDKIIDNPFLKVNDNPLSTFSIDVDAASYSNMRRFITNKQLPPAGAIRIEELINYFSYQYPQPTSDAPFSINTEISSCPWNTKHNLVLVGLQGKIIPTNNLPASNLVFLVDVSGSMMDENKLPLVQSSLKLLVDQLRPQDKVALVVYAGNAGLVLPSTPGENKQKIKDAINKLEAGGSTAGGEGIKLAYKIAKENFAAGGNNRVILCTDGDFNIGISSDDALETLIEQERKSGVFLTVLGYGMGNYQDAKMQKLADKGNGNHAYIDGLSEAKKVLVNEFGGTLFTIAKDVKLQVEFNPNKVQAYRLIGYENRMLAKEDFNNDEKDAGELGSGHTVTALYEIIPVGVQEEVLDSVDALKYQKTKKIKASTDFTNEVMNIKLRYKKPEGDKSELLQHPLADDVITLEKTSDNFRFAAAVAEFGLLLRDSKYKGESKFSFVKELAAKSMGEDKEGYRHEFIKLVEDASALSPQPLKGSKEKTR